MIKKKVGSITLSVGLISAGMLLFAQNFTEIPVKDIYKYWPVLLIGLGLEMVSYILLYGRSNTEVKLSVDGLCIVFIIVIGLISNGVRFMNINVPGHIYFGHRGISIFDGVRYGTQIRETYNRANISDSFDLKELRVTNSFGDIKLLPADSKSIRVEAEVIVKCNDEKKAREYAKDAIEIEEGEVTKISPKNPVNWNESDYSKAQIDLIIYVPSRVNVHAEGSFGDIKAEGIDGKCTIDNKNGTIKAINIGGDVEIENSFGDVEASDIKGSADINNRNGEISAEKISGSAVIEGHFGDIETKAVEGSLKIVNNNGRITVGDVKGKADLYNSFGDINISRINGSIIVESKNGKIEAEHIGGNAEIKNSFGDIFFRSESVNDGDIYAKTNFGSINCEKPLSLNKEGSSIIAQGKFGAGENKIELITNNGDIIIE